MPRPTGAPAGWLFRILFISWTVLVCPDASTGADLPGGRPAQDAARKFPPSEPETSFQAPRVSLPEGAALLVHGGAGTRTDLTAELIGSVLAGARALNASGSPLDGATQAAVALEDHPMFNAGTGSNIRLDGRTVQMDAAVMDESGDFGAVAVIERVKNPVLVAREVMRSPHMLLAGDGAIAFARTMGFPEYDPRSPESRERYRQLLGRMRAGSLGDEWRDFDWKQHWNFPTPLGKLLEQKDTIGAVARDGRGGFAATVSTGGTSITLSGRVGDAPIMGAGIFAGPAGAVCATGWGEYIIRQDLSRKVYRWIEEGVPTQEAVTRGVALFPTHVGVGLIAVSAKDEAAASNTSMAWAGLSGEKWLRADTLGER